MRDVLTQILTKENKIGFFVRHKPRLVHPHSPTAARDVVMLLTWLAQNIYFYLVISGIELKEKEENEI